MQHQRQDGLFRTYREFWCWFCVSVALGALLYVIGVLIGPTLPR